MQNMVAVSHDCAYVVVPKMLVTLGPTHCIGGVADPRNMPNLVILGQTVRA